MPAKPKIPEGWTVTYNPKPIPYHDFDYDFIHEDYNDENGLFGSVASIEEAIEQIKEIESIVRWKL